MNAAWLSQKIGHRIRLLKVVAPNRYELYVSFILVIVGLYFSASRHTGFYHNLKPICCWLLALTCIYNAILDKKHLHWIEYGFALLWFAVLLFCTLWFTWEYIRLPLFGP